MPTKYDPDKHPIDSYLLARSGQTNNAIALALGVSEPTFESWVTKHAALAYALDKARNVLSPNGKGTIETFKEYVYQRLPKNLQRYWDEIDRWHDHNNGAERIEALLHPLGTTVRQSLWLHAMVHTNFRTADALRMVNVSRATLQFWTENDPDFPKLLDQIIWYKKQFFEGALIKLVEDGNTLATLFVNKTVNKETYAETLKVQHSGTINQSHTIHVRYSVDRLNLPLDVRVQVLDAIREIKKAQPVEEPQELAPRPMLQLKPGRARLAILNEDDE